MTFDVLRPPPPPPVLREQDRSHTPPAERDEWRTPPAVFNFAVARWGPFDFDLAATGGNTKCAHYFTRYDDALSLDFYQWHERATRAWCNPPYSDVRPWIRNAIACAREGLASVWLIPAFRGDVYHARETYKVAAEIVLISPRIAFPRPDGTPVAGNVGGSMLVYFDGRPKASEHRATITIETITKGSL
ncbi:MAG: DNA N-6-adenine-methyltransferase [Gammaproteobacteria bacterium]